MKGRSSSAGSLPTRAKLFAPDLTTRRTRRRPATSFHKCPIKLPPREVSYKFDYETELLVVIGKTARNVSEAEALDYVAGSAVGHDFSARDLQFDTGGQWMVGKTLDGFAPIGPYFVSADLVDPNNLAIET